MNESMTAQCPHCGQVYSMQPQQAGQTVACTVCQKPFVAAAQSTSGLAPLQQQQAIYPPMQPVQQESNGIAIASLVCGLILCFPPASLLAIIFGIVGMVKAKNPRVGGRGQATAGLILGVIGPLVTLPVLLAIMLPALNRARETANRIQCASHLNAIGQAILQYENSNGGDFPPDLGTLVKSGAVSPRMCVCPSSNTAAPFNLDSMTPDQQHDWVNANSDYLYYGASLHSGADPASVVVVDKLENHQPDGINVLYANGSVKFEPDADHILKQLNNGVNPPGQ